MIEVLCWPQCSPFCSHCSDFTAPVREPGWSYFICCSLIIIMIMEQHSSLNVVHVSWTLLSVISFNSEEQLLSCLERRRAQELPAKQCSTPLLLDQLSKSSPQTHVNIFHYDTKQASTSWLLCCAVFAIQDILASFIQHHKAGIVIQNLAKKHCISASCVTRVPDGCWCVHSSGFSVVSQRFPNMQKHIVSQCAAIWNERNNNSGTLFWLIFTERKCSI